MLRTGRIEEQKQKRRLAIAIVGSISILVFFSLFGLKILVGFSLLVDKLRGNSPTQQTASDIILPPILDPIANATNSSTLIINGSAQAELSIMLFVDDEESEKSTVSNNGTFSLAVDNLTEGTKHISAKVSDSKGNVSDLSNVLTVFIKKKPPILELAAPEDKSTLNGDDNKVIIEGKTEDDTSITVNDRIIVVSGDNSFTYKYPLNEGENKLKIVARDAAGNTTTVEKSVTYRK